MKLITTIMTLSCLALTSCNSIRHQSYEKINVTSNPPQAAITVDGYPCGMTPQIVQVDSRQSHLVLLEKEGYRPQQYVVRSRIQGNKLASNLAFPILGGGIGAGAGLLATTGAVTGPAGAIVALGAIGGVLVGTAVGAIGTGADLGSGYARGLDTKHIHAQLE